VTRPIMLRVLLAGPSRLHFVGQVYRTSPV